MNRLTNLVDGEWRENHDNDTKQWKNGNRECMNKLAAYENTGLEPQEILTGLELADSIRQYKKLKRYEQLKTEGDTGYINWIENMIVLLSKCYQETHDMLFSKAKQGDEAYFNIPTVQGMTLVMAVTKISKLEMYGTVPQEKIREYISILESNQNSGGKPLIKDGGARNNDQP